MVTAQSVSWRRTSLGLALVLAVGPAPGSELAAATRMAEAGDPAAALERLAAADASAERYALEHSLLMQQGRFADAGEAAARWLTTLPEGGARSAALHALAASLAARRLAVEAAPRFEEALAAALAEGDGHAAVEIEIALGWQRIGLGELAAAGVHLARATMAARDLDAEDSFTYALANLEAQLAGERGEMQAGLDAAARALAAARRLDDPAQISTALTNLGSLHFRVHDYAAAIEAHREALALLQDARPDRRAIALSHLGIAYFELNRWHEAEATFVEAGRAAEAAESSALIAWVEGELGLVAWNARRDADEAVARFELAIEMTRSIGDRRNESVWWQNLARVYRDLERCDEALPHYRRAQALQEAMAAPAPNLLKHLGQCHAALGEDAIAAVRFDDALALARRMQDHKVIWETERERARLLARQGQPVAASEAYLAALDAIETMRRSLALPAFKTDFFQNKVAVYEETASWLVDALDDPAAAFAVAERARARAFLDLLAESHARVEATLPEEALAEERRFTDEVSRLTAALRRGEADNDLAAELEAAEAALEAMRLRVRREHPGYRALRDPQPASAAEVGTWLGEDEALLAFLLGEAASHRWWLRGGKLHHARLAPKAEIEAAVRRAYAGLSRPEGDIAAVAEASRLLLAGLDGETLPARTLVVPDGILFLLPFEVLSLEDGSELGAATLLAQLPAAALLGLLPDNARAHPGVPRLLALGASNREGGGAASLRSAAALGEIGRLGALPQAEREAQRTAALWGHRHAIVLLGESASEARLRALPLPDFAVVHIAAHGWLDPGSAARSAVVLASDGDHDGLLQVREILGLRLDADLVTLSACRSGLGELVSGEGVVGVTRAFLHAGARNVVASLWSVEDAASAAFMDHFYRALRDGRDPAAALAKARTEMRRQARWSHPYYWAPWILVGRGDAVRTPPQRRVPVAPLAGAILLFAAIAPAWYWRRRRARGK